MYDDSAKEKQRIAHTARCEKTVHFSIANGPSVAVVAIALAVPAANSARKRPGSV